MSGKVVFPGKSESPLSKGVKAGGLLFLSGHVAGPKDKIDPTSMESQTRGTLQNIARSLGECGSSLEDVVRVTIYITDMSLKPGMDAAYREFFPSDPPARSTLGIKELASPEYLIEIDVVAIARD